MKAESVKKVLLAGLQGKATQWRGSPSDLWEDDDTISMKIYSAHLAITSGRRGFQVRVKPGQTGDKAP